MLRTVLSLDGYMAVDLETDKLTVGETVDVQLADGSFVQGKVESAAGGKCADPVSRYFHEYHHFR